MIFTILPPRACEEKTQYYYYLLVFGCKITIVNKKSKLVLRKFSLCGHTRLCVVYAHKGAEKCSF